MLNLKQGKSWMMSQMINWQPQKIEEELLALMGLIVNSVTKLILDVGPCILTSNQPIRVSNMCVISVIIKLQHKAD